MHHSDDEFVPPPPLGQLMPRVITLSGLVQSGKNATLAELAKLLPHYRLADCSKIVRQMAADRGIPFREFVDRVTNEPDFMPDYDEQIDSRALALMLEPEPVIIAGRIQHYLARRHPKLAADTFAVCLDASRQTRINRASPDSVIAGLAEVQRDENDMRRYQKMDLLISLPATIGEQPHNVHMLISTELYRPEEIAERIHACARCWANGWSFVPDHTRRPQPELQAA